MALFKKLISAVKKLFRGRPGRSRKRKKIRYPSRPRRIKKKGTRKHPLRKIRKPKHLARKKKKSLSARHKSKKALRAHPIRSKKAKPVKIKPPVAVKPAPPAAAGILIGEVTHYFPKIKVCVVKVTHGSFAVGDQIRIKGNHGELTQKVLSLQIESQDVKVASKGQLVGLKVVKPARPGDKVFKLPR